VAHAVCIVPTPLPTVPLPPIFSVDVTHHFINGVSTPVHVEFWRQPCEPGSTPGELVLYVRLTPSMPGSTFTYANVTLIQAGQQIEPTLRKSPNGDTITGNLFVPVTAIIEIPSGQPPFNDDLAFTFIYGTTDKLEVPAAGQGPTFGITVVSTGCNPCSAGQIATFHLHTSNPGQPLGVDLRAGLRLPNGPNVAIFGPCTVAVVESGEHDIPLLSIIVPGDVPNGTYAIEAAILDPVFGATLSRHSLNAVKQ
jgi:hypothetical protein